MNIVVQPANWGDVRLSDIGTVLMDTASHINEVLRTPFRGTIIAVHVPESEPPRVLCRPKPESPFAVLLPARERRWAQYAYQFSHEFCHILSNFERLENNPNNWFHESICETASVFSLRRMAERWSVTPPYPNWNDYSLALSAYATDLLSRPQVKLTDSSQFPTWLKYSSRPLCVHERRHMAR